MRRKLRWFLSAAVPGQIGGATAMNAGGRWGDFWDVVESVRVLDCETGTVRDLPRAECRPTYRDGGMRGFIVLGAVVRLRRDASAVVQARVSEYLQTKRRVQPVTEWSAGCIFKNPDPEESGGRSADVFTLIEDVRDLVREKSGVELAVEVKTWRAGDVETASHGCGMEGSLPAELAPAGSPGAFPGVQSPRLSWFPQPVKLQSFASASAAMPGSFATFVGADLSGPFAPAPGARRRGGAPPARPAPQPGVGESKAGTVVE